jgi:hypothetical protein
LTEHSFIIRNKKCENGRLRVERSLAHAAEWNIVDYLAIQRNTYLKDGSGKGPAVLKLN